MPPHCGRRRCAAAGPRALARSLWYGLLTLENAVFLQNVSIAMAELARMELAHGTRQIQELLQTVEGRHNMLRE